MEPKKHQLMTVVHKMRGRFGKSLLCVYLYEWYIGV